MAVIVHTGTDPLGRAAVDRAAQEAVLRDLPLVLVAHVAMPRGETDAASFQRRRDETAAQLEAQAEGLRTRGVTCAAELPSAPGSRADAVLAAAREHGAALIVIGARRRSPVGKALFGSWAQDILLAADCPVLVVKLPREDEDAL